MPEYIVFKSKKNHQGSLPLVAKNKKEYFFVMLVPFP